MSFLKFIQVEVIPEGISSGAWWDNIAVAIIGFFTGLVAKIPDLMRCKQCKEDLTKLEARFTEIENKQIEDAKQIELFRNKYTELLGAVQWAHAFAGEENPALQKIIDIKNKEDGR